MSNPKGRHAYEPEEGTIVYILLAHGYHDVREIAEAVGVAPNTILSWDRRNVWPCWAIEHMGFTVKFGPTQLTTVIRTELRQLRDSINETLNNG